MQLSMFRMIQWFKMVLLFVLLFSRSYNLTKHNTFIHSSSSCCRAWKVTYSSPISRWSHSSSILVTHYNHYLGLHSTAECSNATDLSRQKIGNCHGPLWKQYFVLHDLKRSAVIMIISRIGAEALSHLCYCVCCTKSMLLVFVTSCINMKYGRG